MSMKTSIYIIGNRTRDLPACSAVPQPTAPPRAPILCILRLIISNQAFLPIMYRRGWTVRGSNPGKGEICRTLPHWPWAHTVFNTLGVGLFLGVKQPRRGTDHPPHVTPRFKKECIPLLPLWAFMGELYDFFYLFGLYRSLWFCICCGDDTKSRDAS
jgi:hypothetical protein